MEIFFFQAHAKVWHTYDTLWRGKQQGKQRWKIMDLPCVVGLLRTVVLLLRSGWHLFVGGLG